jgi:hypothetical protein
VEARKHIEEGREMSFLTREDANLVLKKLGDRA